MDEKLKIGIEDHSVLLNTILSFPINEIKNYAQNLMLERSYIKLKEIKFTYLTNLEEKIDNNISIQKIDLINVLNNQAIKNLDIKWCEHLTFIEEARQNVGFRALAQKQPLQEFKKICFDSFSSLLKDFKYQVLEDYLSLINNDKKIEESLIIEIENNRKIIEYQEKNELKEVVDF